MCDCFRKPIDGSTPRFDRSLEEFYAICDQIELNLVSVEANVLQITSNDYVRKSLFCDDCCFLDRFKRDFDHNLLCIIILPQIVFLKKSENHALHDLIYQPGTWTLHPDTSPCF